MNTAFDTTPFWVESASVFRTSFAAVASKETDTLIFHQDAFAADLQNEELALLGAAIKFAGHHGKAIIVNGRCGGTVKDDVLRSPSQA